MISGRWRSWWWDAALLAALALWTWLVAAGGTDRLDLAVRSWSMDHDPAWARGIAIVSNHFGQGWVLQWVLGGALTLIALVRRRTWRVLLPAVAAYLITGLGAGPLKIWTHRDAPSSGLPPDVSVQLFNPEATGYSRSYPSGHIVNTMVWWPAILLLLALVLAPRTVPAKLRRFLLVGPPIIVFATTCYLSYHWVSDDVAAVFLGLFLARLFWRLPWKSWVGASI
ncbi:phosphatase PAP2 family protein [Hamadaea tsunoensis]|uniref:phosphatase PAP2 family protein n=1 Tax=Hamadaea tsunoensis TaxID=53368 RepID=UPI0003FC0F66|nr:phosphatase PAP2 family protein [Hamadaea tsunoensis]